MIGTYAFYVYVHLSTNVVPSEPRRNRKIVRERKRKRKESDVFVELARCTPHRGGLFPHHPFFVLIRGFYMVIVLSG